MSQNEIISIKPIGYVKTEAKGKEVRDKNRTSKIIIFRDYIDALEGIEGFSHIVVLFWLDRISTKQKILKVHPRGKIDLPLLGVFATRSMFRPNPIGLTVVELIKKENDTLLVRGLDAFNFTPVLDLKPFDFWDSDKKLTVPNWWMDLEKRV